MGRALVIIIRLFYKINGCNFLKKFRMIIYDGFN
jgi:hypothetical protein